MATNGHYQDPRHQRSEHSSLLHRYWEREEETQRERGSQPLEKANKSQNQQSSSSLNNNQNKHQKKLFVPRDSGSSSQNTDKKTSDLNDKIGKDGKLTTAE